MLRRLKEQGITIIASTPIVDEARQCDRIAFINEGRIHGIDTPDCIMKQFADILCPSGLLHEKADNRENYVIEVDGLTNVSVLLRLWSISPSKSVKVKYSAFWEPMEPVRLPLCACSRG